MTLTTVDLYGHEKREVIAALWMQIALLLSLLLP